ncbi:MAG: response regulator [bacterium]
MSSKILIVDDHLPTVELIKVNLEKHGHTVSAAFDGAQAVRTAHKEMPRLIILDILLPAGSGIWVLDRLRLSTETALIPIIIMSGHTREELRRKIPDFEKKMKEFSILFFETKPIINIDEFIMKINSHCT